MKKIGYLLLLVLLQAGILFAQPPQNRGNRITVEERAKKTTEWMTKELNLTKEQIIPIDSINLLFTKAQHILFQTADGDRDKIRDSMTALEQEKDNSLSAYLTPDQMKIYKEKVKEMATAGPRNREGNPGNRRSRDE